jgi:hypothetical protein
MPSGSRRNRRTPPTAQEVHATYLPDVPFEALCGMALGKSAPDTPADHARVIARIKREADLRVQTRAHRHEREFQALSPDAQQDFVRDLLGLWVLAPVGGHLTGMTPSQTSPAPLAHTPVLSSQTALDELRAAARSSPALRTRLARLGRLIAAGRPVQLSGPVARVRAAQQAVLAYAARWPARVVLTPQDVLGRLTATELSVSLHDQHGWPLCTYGLTRVPEGVRARTQDGRTRVLTDAAFLALFQTSTYSLRVAPQAASLASAA